MPTILIVDDEPVITDFITEALVDEGHQVRACHDGAAALAEVRRERPDLLLLDIGLPLLSGDEVLRTLRSDGYADLPVVVMTAVTNAERFLAQGATAVLRKPFVLEQLLSAVESSLAP